VKFDPAARANGTAWVTARLYADDGTPYGAPMKFQVKVTEITSTVLLVLAGGVLLLVLAGIRMYTQRKQAAARGGADASTGSPESAAPRSERQSDVVPDTAPENGGVPDAGEKVDR
jgi:hypothetical protein